MNDRIPARAQTRSAPSIPRQRVPLKEPLFRGGETPSGQAQPTLNGSVSVIVPTRNEAGNVDPLVRRLSAVLRGWPAEVLFVDDSDDDTPDRVVQAARTSAVPVQLHHRSKEVRTGGLGGAVIAGLAQVDSSYAVVMDGDLQHPPELVTAMLVEAQETGADVVVASRHVPGGSSSGLANVGRVGASVLAAAVTKLLFPRRLRHVTDPMSGFFLVRCSALRLGELRPEGFKILVEILARTGGLQKREVPLVFAARHTGESKASLREGGRFARQIGRIWLDRLRGWRPARTSRGLVTRGTGFAAVGLSGLVVNMLLMWAMVEASAQGTHYIVAAAVATQLSSTWNFLWVDTLVYSGPKRLTRLRRWIGAMALSNLVLVVRIPLIALLVSALGVHYLLANAVSLVLGTLVRFGGQERLSLPKEVR